MARDNVGPTTTTEWITMTNHDGRADDAPDQDSNGAGSESPEEGAAAQQDADEAATTEASPTGDIG